MDWIAAGMATGALALGALALFGERRRAARLDAKLLEIAGDVAALQRSFVRSFEGVSDSTAAQIAGELSHLRARAEATEKMLNADLTGGVAELRRRMARAEPLLAAIDEALPALQLRVGANEQTLQACVEWLDKSHEPMLTSHGQWLSMLDRRVGEAEAQRRADSVTHAALEQGLSALQQAHRQAEATLNACVEWLGGSHEPRLATLEARATAAEEGLKGCVEWLGASHEPRLDTLEMQLRQSYSRQTTFAGALDQLVARGWRSQAALADAVAAGKTGPRTAHLALAREELADLAAQRKAAKRRGALPLGETGALDGIRTSRGHRPILVVAFSGVREQFGWMARLEALGVSVIHLCDSQERWYLEGCDGSGGIKPTLAALRQAIDSLPHERLVIMGLSMGGYAALRLGPALDPDLILAFAPQTHRALTTTLAGVLLQPPEGVVDIRPMLIESGVRAEILISADEGGEKYVWDDHAQVAGLEDAPNICVRVVDCHTHATSQHLSATGRLDAVLESAFAIAAGKTPPLDFDKL